MPSIDDFSTSNYLKAADLQGREIPVTVERVAVEEIGRNKDRKIVLYFVGKQKSLVCNRTINKYIAGYLRDKNYENWVGAKIVLYPTTTEFGGDMVDCIRVKAPPREATQSADNGGSGGNFRGRSLPASGPRNIPAVNVDPAIDEGLNDPVPF